MMANEAEIGVATAVISPVEALIVATDVLALFHVPPVGVVIKVVVVPGHIGELVITAGNALTVTSLETTQPETEIR